MPWTPPPDDPLNPYPETWDRVDAFEYVSPLSLIRPVANLLDRLGEDGDYVLQHDFDCSVSVDGERRMLSAPRGLVTDLTSVPLLLRPFVGRVGPWLEAAIIHDYLYVAWVFLPDAVARATDRAFADRVMLLAMERAGVRRWRRLGIFWGLRLFGAGAYGRADARRVFVDLGEPELRPAFVVPRAGV